MSIEGVRGEEIKLFSEPITFLLSIARLQNSVWGHAAICCNRLGFLMTNKIKNLQLIWLPFKWEHRVKKNTYQVLVVGRGYGTVAAQGWRLMVNSWIDPPLGNWLKPPYGTRELCKEACFLCISVMWYCVRTRMIFRKISLVLNWPHLCKQWVKTYKHKKTT